MTCQEARTLFSNYLDGRLNGVEMQGISQHLDVCVACAQAYQSLGRTQALVASIGRRPAPPDLALRLRVALSRERSRSMRSRWESAVVRAENLVNAFMLPATAGVVTSVLLLGIFVGFFAGPRNVPYSQDVPTSLYMPPRLASSPFLDNIALDSDGPVVIEADVNPSGQLEDYRIISGQDNERVRKQLDRSLLFTVFEPAMSFGQPARGKVVISFSSVNVKG
ncbi:MAG: zf-HC2 domain-containing protein [Acidobacteriales bacterium]|nr:zf-HC2 domain-containing protein [Terriglobales bacterium]